MKHYLNYNKAQELYTNAEGYSLADVLVSTLDNKSNVSLFKGNLYTPFNAHTLYFYSTQMIRDWAHRIDNGFRQLFRPSPSSNFTTTPGDVWKPSINPWYFFKENIKFQNKTYTTPKVSANLPLYQVPLSTIEYALTTQDTKVAFSLVDATHMMIPHIPYLKSNNALPVCLQYYMTDAYIDAMKNQKAFALKDPVTLQTLKYTFSNNLPYGVGVRYNCLTLSDFLKWFDKEFDFNQPATATKEPTGPLERQVLMSFNVNAEFVDRWLGYGDHLIVDVEPAEWYISWQNDYNAWQCQPVTGKHITSEDYTKVITSDNNNEEYVQEISITPKLELYTDYLSDEEYREWQGIERSRFIYVYNSVIDKGWWVKSTATTSVTKNYLNDGMLAAKISVELSNKITY